MLRLALFLAMGCVAVAPRQSVAADGVLELGSPTAVDLTSAPEADVVVGGGAAVLDIGMHVCRVVSPAWVTPHPSKQTQLTIAAESAGPEWIVLEVDPAVGENGGSADATQQGGCKDPERRRIFLSRLDKWPVAKAEVTVHADSRVAEATGEGLRGRLLVALSGGKVAAAERCRGHSTCTVGLQTEHVAALLRRDDSAKILLLADSPPLEPGGPAPAILRADGGWDDGSAFAVGGLRFEFAGPLVQTSTLHAGRERLLLPVELPEAIADVSCKHARCSLTSRGIELYAIDRASLLVTLKLVLQPNVFRNVDGSLATKDTVELEVKRCGVRTPPQAPLLAGVSSHRYFIAVARECLKQESVKLAVETWPPTSAYVRTEVASPDQTWRLFEVVFDKVPRRARHLDLTVFRLTPLRVSLDKVRLPVTSDYRPVNIKLEVPGLGLIDFIPANQSARVALAFDDADWLSQFTVVGRSGYYEVEREADDVFVRAIQGASGSVPLRLAYAPQGVRELLGRLEPLAKIDSEARYAIRKINIPLPLNPDDDKTPRFLRLTCGQGDHVVEVPPGRTASIPFAARHSCRLSVDRERIPQWAGEQRLRLTSNTLNQLITVRHRSGSLMVPLSADGKREFDTLTLSVAHEYGGGHYDFSPQHNIGAEATYALVLGDRDFRVTAGTALPTGLFRFGRKEDRGAVPFSAGAVARIVWLYREGSEFPMGLELGMLGTGLSDEPHLSVVTGLGLSVPVLNPNTPLQTSFNLHAWVEYSPTRTGKDESKWAFLFGPSFAVGRFSVNL